MSTNATRAPRKDRTHYLYLAVIAAVVAGITVGLVAPDFAIELKPLGTGFVQLIKMMIAPVIFCTLVLGVGSVANASQVGKVGGLALGYFVTMSFAAISPPQHSWSKPLTSTLTRTTYLGPRSTPRMTSRAGFASGMGSSG